MTDTQFEFSSMQYVLNHPRKFDNSYKDFEFQKNSFFFLRFMV